MRYLLLIILVLPRLVFAEFKEPSGSLASPLPDKLRDKQKTLVKTIAPIRPIESIEIVSTTPQAGAFTRIAWSAKKYVLNEPKQSDLQQRTPASSDPSSSSPVQLKGKIIANSSLSKKDWVVTALRSSARTNDQGDFVVPLTFSGKKMVVPIQLRSPAGYTDIHIVEITRSSEITPKISPWAFLVGAGYSINNYQEYRVISLKQLSITPKAAISYQISPRWNASVSGFGTAAAIQKTNNQITRFIGINGRFGVSVLPMDWKMRLAIGVGGYMTNVLPPDGTYGFLGVMGPQVFPVLGYKFEKFILNFYGKYSPISAGGFSFLNMNNREIALGTSMVTKFPFIFDTFALTFDYANLNLDLQGVPISSTSSSFGF